jgi:hypothetical protein
VRPVIYPKECRREVEETKVLEVTKMKQVTQTELSELVRGFSAVMAQLRKIAKRSNPDRGGSVEDGKVKLTEVVNPEDLQILGDSFREIVPSWPIPREQIRADARVRRLEREFKARKKLRRLNRSTR